MSGPLVGIVISTLNAKTHLQDCLDSVFAQSDSAWEIAVVDGGSTDGTIEIIRRNASRLAYWISEPDKGIYDAWNKALPHLSAPWILFLGADDYFADEKVLEKMRPVLEKAEGAQAIVYGRVELVDDAGGHIGFLGQPWAEISTRFRSEMCIPHQAVFQHKSLVANGFDSGFRFAGDYELMLREVLRRAPLFHDLVVAAWRQGGLTSRPELSSRVFEDFRIAQFRHGIGRRFWGAAHIRAQAKYALFRLLGSAIGGWLLNLYRKTAGRPSRND